MIDLEITNKAIAKTTDEMMKNGHPFAIFIEEYLTRICINKSVAEKLLDPEKSLDKFVNKVISDMKEIAQKNRTGNAGIAGAPDEEFFRMVEEYYGITEEDKVGTMEDTRTNVIDITDFL